MNLSQMSLTTSCDESNGDHLISSSQNLEIVRIKGTVGSTQDEAKRLIEERFGKGDEERALAILADSQTGGRGTNGRTWVATDGNLFLTCAIPMKQIPMSKITLLPLGVGVTIAECLEPYCSIRPTLKWPNDVLIDGRKIAGTLIENYRSGLTDYWLVGIGINVLTHPQALLPDQKDFRSKPRLPTSLAEFRNPSVEMPNAVGVGKRIALKLQHWVEALDGSEKSAVTASWKQWADFGSSHELRETGEKVKIVDIKDDGRLQVVDQNGTTKTLVSDYFY